MRPVREPSDLPRSAAEDQFRERNEVIELAEIETTMAGRRGGLPPADRERRRMSRRWPSFSPSREDRVLSDAAGFWPPLHGIPGWQARIGAAVATLVPDVGRLGSVTVHVGPGNPLGACASRIDASVRSQIYSSYAKCRSGVATDLPVEAAS
jgi:hypothetical protein